MQTLDHYVLVNMYSLVAAGVAIFLISYWIWFSRRKPIGRISVARPIPRDPHGKGYLSTAYAYDDSFAPSTYFGDFGPLPVWKKRKTGMSTTHRKKDD
jgi:hypothetical protein